MFGLTGACALAFNVWVWWQEQQPADPKPQAASEDVNWLLRIWYDYINRGIPVGNFTISVASIALGLLVLVAAFALSRTVRGFAERRMARRAHIDPGLQYTILRLIHYCVVVVGVVVSVRLAFSADLTSLAVLFTALSVGIGFGLQYLAGDIASGFVLLFERPVRVGDFVSVKGVDGEVMDGRVVSINLRTTVVMTNDHIAAVVPNSKLVNESIVNWTFRERRSRLSIPVGVSYDADVQLVTDTLLRAAEGVPHLLDEPKPSVQFMEFGDWSLNFRLLVWTDKPRRYPQIKSDINYNIRRLFLEAGIEIPFPQSDLRLREGSLRLKTALGAEDDGEGDGRRETDEVGARGR